jgi:hypothetical protein
MSHLLDFVYGGIPESNYWLPVHFVKTEDNEVALKFMWQLVSLHKK